MTGQSRLLLWNTITSYLRVMVTVLLSLWLIPFIITHLGQEEFGLWSLLFSVLALVSLMEFGLGTAAMRFIAHHRGSGDEQARNRVFTLALIGYVVLTLLSVAVIFVLSLFFNSFFAIPAEHQQNATWLLWILGMRMVLGHLPLNLFRSVLFGEQQIAPINALMIVGHISYAGFAYVTLSSGGGVIALAWANLLAMLVEHLGYVVVAWLRVPGLRLTLYGVTRAELMEVAQFTGFQGLINIAALLLLQMDLMIIKAFLPLTAVAIYAVALKIASHVRLLIKQFVNVLSPRLAELKGAGKEAEIRRLFLMGSQLTLIPGVIVLVALFYLGEAFITSWVGAGFESGFTVLILLTLSVVIDLPHRVASTLLMMTGEHRYNTAASLGSLAVNLTLSLILIQFWGIVGVAVATLVATVLVDVFMIVRRACSLYTVSTAEYLQTVCLPAVLPGVVQGLFLILALALLGTGSLLQQLSLGLCSALVYCLIYYWWSLPPHIKHFVHGEISKRVRNYG